MRKKKAFMMLRPSVAKSQESKSSCIHSVCLGLSLSSVNLIDTRQLWASEFACGKGQTASLSSRLEISSSSRLAAFTCLGESASFFFQGHVFF